MSLKKQKKNEIEAVYIQDAFNLAFSAEKTTNFLDLVTKDISEDMDEDEEVYSDTI